MLASISRFGRGWIGRRSRCRSPSIHQERKVVGRSRTVLPRELGLDVATGGQRLHGLDDEQVLDGDLGVLGEVVVLLGDEDSLTEEGLSLEYLVSLMFDSHSYPNAVADIHPAVVRRDRKAKVCLVQSRSRDVFSMSAWFRCDLFEVLAELVCCCCPRASSINGLVHTSWIALRSALGISIVAIEFDLPTLVEWVA